MDEFFLKIRSRYSSKKLGNAVTEPQPPLASLPAVDNPLSPLRQQRMELERIFMPQARKQRAEHHSRENHDGGARFVHYTSAENALKIIQSKRLWLRTLCACQIFAKSNTASISSNGFLECRKRRKRLRLLSNLARPASPMKPSRFLIRCGLSLVTKLLWHPFQSTLQTKTSTADFQCGERLVISPVHALPSSYAFRSTLTAR